MRGLAALALGGLLAAAAPALAEEQDVSIFDVSLSGISAGTLQIAGAINGGSYAARGTLKSGGLAGLVAALRYEAAVTGRLMPHGFVPGRYEENADTGKRQSEAVMNYVSGVPQVKMQKPARKPRKKDVDPATQGGTVDPLTALYAVLRAVPAGEACNLTLFLFDGRRRSQVTLGAPETTDGELLCDGEYRRLEGFSDDDMAEHSRFAFRLRYGPAGEDKLRVVEVWMDTIYGRGRMVRR